MWKLHYSSCWRHTQQLSSTPIVFLSCIRLPEENNRRKLIWGWQKVHANIYHVCLWTMTKINVFSYHVWFILGMSVRVSQIATCFRQKIILSWLKQANFFTLGNQVRHHHHLDAYIVEFLVLLCLYSTYVCVQLAASKNHCWPSCNKRK